MFTACSPVCMTHPKITSSTIAGSIPARPVTSRSTCAARMTGCTSRRSPLRWLPRPIGVRTASTITTSVMFHLLFGRFAHLSSGPAAGRRSDELGEETARPVPFEVELLGMALESDNETPSRVFHGLDKPVVRACGHHEVAAEAAQRLVMHAVDIDDLCTRDRAQPRVGRYVDAVGELLTRAVLGVVVLGCALGADVLPERPSKRDVEHLCASADGEHRLVDVERPACEQQLRPVEVLVNLDRAVGARFLAVQRRLDVRTAGKAHAVTEVEQLAQAWLGQRCADSERSPTGTLERIEVR